MTLVPYVTVAVQVPLAQVRPGVLELTDPPGPTMIVSVGENIAPTVTAADIVTLHAPVPMQAPLHPVNA